jgi:hypothetical protein
MALANVSRQQLNPAAAAAATATPANPTPTTATWIRTVVGQEHCSAAAAAAV